MTEEHKGKLAIGRQQARERKTQSAGGIGESRIFADPNAIDANAQLRECHIDGKLIRDYYTEDQISVLRWAWTDEGIAAANVGKLVGSGATVSDPIQKQLQRKKDDVLSRGMETYEASDPMREVIDEHGRPGFRNRFLSDSTVKKRGMRGWQPVVKDGEPVKLGGMVLAEMPVEKAVQRNKHYRDLGNDRLKQVTESYKEAVGGAAVSDQ